MQNLDQWVEKSENELVKKVRVEALSRKKNDLTQVLRELSAVEALLIIEDIGDKSKYDKDHNKLEELVGSRIEALYDVYSTWNKKFLNEIKEKTKSELKFRADFLGVVGHQGGEEISDELIINYQERGFADGGEAGQVYLNGWKEPAKIYDRHIYLENENITYSFSVTDTTREQAEEEITASRILRKLIYQPKSQDDLKELEAHLQNLENLIPQNSNDLNSDKPIQGENLLTLAQRFAYQRNKLEAACKQKELIEKIDSLQKKNLIKNLDLSLRKINNSIKDIGGIKSIKGDEFSTPISDLKKRINDKAIRFERVEAEVKRITPEIRQVLIERLKEIYRKTRARTRVDNFDDFFPETMNLESLAEKYSEVVNEIRGEQKKNATDALQELLISKEEGENLLQLNLNLSNLQSLIPSEGSENSLTGKTLTPDEIATYKKKKKEVDEKELALLKKIIKQEAKEKEFVLEVRELKLIDRAKDKIEFEEVKKQLSYEWKIEEVLQNTEQALEKNDLLDSLYRINSLTPEEFKEGEEWKEAALFSKRRNVEGVTKWLKVKIKECEFVEYLEKVNHETELLELDKLVTDWEENLWHERVGDKEMPEGKKTSDLLIAINERKKEIRENNLSQRKTPQEELEEVINERDVSQGKINNLNQLLKEEVGIELKEDNWDNLLNVIREKGVLEKKIEQSEAILGVPLEDLDYKIHSLVNLIEVAELLTIIGVEREENENGQRNYDLEKLRINLIDLKEKKEAVKLLQETIESRNGEIERIRHELEQAAEEILKNSTTDAEVGTLREKNEEMLRDLQNKEQELQDKKAELENQEKGIQNLTQRLSDANGEIEKLSCIILGNAKRERERERERARERVKENTK